MVAGNPNFCDSEMENEQTMFLNKCKGKIACLIATCVSSARCLLFVTFAAVLAYSPILPIISHTFRATASSRKPPRNLNNKAIALSTSTVRLSSSYRDTFQKVVKPAWSNPPHHSIRSSWQIGTQPIHCPIFPHLRC